jgi:hypothetical protein
MFPRPITATEAGGVMAAFDVIVDSFSGFTGEVLRDAGVRDLGAP